jgi:DnaJ-class molecular chaperone
MSPLCNPCPDCDGPAIDLGYGAGDGKCSVCHGTGSDMVPDLLPGQTHDCYNCNGSGTCPTCMGTGEIIDEE